MRSKDTSIEDIIQVSNDLLDDNLDVYLPNKVIFVFELLCDRLGDNKSKKYRVDPEIWLLFNKTWTLLDSQPKIRNRTFQGLKFGEALASALSHTGSSKQFLETITTTINFVRFNSVISNNVFEFSLDILTQYLELLYKISNELEEEEVSIKVNGISSFLQSIISTEKISKKFTTNFASTSLPSILRLSEARQQQYPQLLALIKKILLSKEQQESLIPNLVSLINTKPSTGAIVNYYRIIIDTISKNDIETAEKMFTLITEKHPTASEQLLGYLSSIKRTLSQTFLDSIIDKEFSNNQQNWNLVSSVVQLDIEIGIKNSEKIMTSLEEQDYEEDLKLGEQLVNSFIRARELVNFFELWLKVIKTNSTSRWLKPEFTEIVSNNIHVLSFSQLKTLIDLLLSSDVDVAELTLLNTVVQGLFKTQDTVLVQQARGLFSPIWTINQDQDQLWYLKFQLLCLYEDILDSSGFEKIIKESKSPKHISHYYTLFRVREIFEYDISPVASKFLSFLKKSKQSSEILQTVFTRWFVLINLLFTSEQIEQIVDLLLSDVNSASKIFENDLLFEQQKITEALIDQISSSFSDKKADKSFGIQVLKLIPIQCYPRRLKSLILDQLVDEVLSKHSSNKQIILETIQHILQTPTFRSKIESDISTIFKIVDTFPETNLFEKIWPHYIQQIKETTSQDFISSIIDHVTQSFSQGKSNKLSSSFYIGFTILSNPPSTDASNVLKLKSAFVNASKRLLNSFIDKSKGKNLEISWLLNVLYQLNLSVEDFKLLKPSIQNFGKQLTEGDNVAKTNIFLLFSKFPQTGDFSIEYFEALYIVLRDSGISSEELLKGLGNVVSSLTQEEFSKSFKVLIESFNEHSDNSLYFVEILSIHWKFFQRDSPDSIKFFINSLSTVLLNFHKISHSQGLIHILNSIKTLLVEKTWIITQYGLELIITLLSKTADSLLISNNIHSEEIYQSLTTTLSTILLIQRYRLSNRHHLIISLFKSLLACLSKRQHNEILSSSINAGEKFSRVLTNLCEPSQHSFKEASNGLNSSTSLAKKALRKHLPVLLLSYIYFALKYSFNSHVREAILPGVFSMFDVFSQDELVLVSTSLDYSGRTYYRSLYDDYKKIGKWKTD